MLHFYRAGLRLAVLSSLCLHRELLLRKRELFLGMQGEARPALARSRYSEHAGRRDASDSSLIILDTMPDG